MRGQRFPGTLAAVLLCSVAAVAADGGPAPRIDGEWWQVAGDPDLGKYTNPKQQPVDFAVWQAADGTWQLWSCIRGTNCGGKTRLFHVKCNKVGELDPSMWLADMPGGTWGFHDQRRFWSEHHGLTPDHAIAAADLTAIAKQHALVDAKPHRETWLEPYTNDEKYSGINFLHEQHDELWCEAQFPYGLGGGHHDYVECFDARGQLRGVDLAEDNDKHPHATACGSLASMPDWIEKR